jgi:peptide/nickel transport system permease protein
MSAALTEIDPRPDLLELRRSRVVIRVLRDRGGLIGALLLISVVLVATLGPLVAPNSPSALLSRPFAPPGTSGLALGADYLGRDALSRFLHGGASLLFTALAAIALTYGVGTLIGLLAAFRRGLFDVVLMGLLDVTLAFPPIIFVLILLTAVGSQRWLVAVGVAAIFLPRVARIVRSAALSVVTQEFVEAAVARGETTRAVLVREVLPNLWPPILADLGIRLTGAVIVIASLSFLGFGEQPPAADWGSLISENRSGIESQPWVILAPVLAIGALTIGVNLVADAFLRSIGAGSRSVQR